MNMKLRKTCPSQGTAPAAGPQKPGVPLFNVNLLKEYRMQWALSQDLVVNGRHRCRINTFKLATKSELFKELLRLNGRQQDLHFQTDNPADLELVVRFCHLGCLELDTSNVAQVLRIASEYRITTLAARVDEFVRGHLNDELCWLWWRVTRQYQPGCGLEVQSRVLVEEYVLRHFLRASQTMGFSELSPDELLALLQDDRLNVPDEYALIAIVARWVEASPASRAASAGRLLAGVRLGLLSLEQVETLWKSQILKRTQSNDCLTSIRQARRSLVRSRRNLRPLDKCGGTLDGQQSQPQQLQQQPDGDINASVTATAAATAVCNNGTARPRYPHEAIFVFGGWEAGSASRAVRVYDARARRWLSYTSSRDNSIVLPRPLMSFGIALFRGGTQVLVLGGEVRSQQATQEVLCYDLAARSWQHRPPMHEVRRDLAAVNLNDEAVYAIGGDNNKTVLDSVERYHPGRNQWLEVAPMLLMRSAPAADTLAGRIYVLGGYTESQMEALTASCECYDPATDQWSYIKPMSQQRYYFNALAQDGNLYVLGGGDETQWSTVERYSPSADCWAPMPSLLQQRADFAACVLEDEFYCLGGGGDSFCTAEVEHWHPGSSSSGGGSGGTSAEPAASWQRGISLPCPTWGHRCVTVRGVNIILPYLKYGAVESQLPASQTGRVTDEFFELVNEPLDLDPDDHGDDDRQERDNEDDEDDEDARAPLEQQVEPMIN